MRVVGGYSLFEELGRGRYGIIYRAEHRSTGRRCAVKEMRVFPGQRAVRLREVESLRRVESPFVVEIIDEVWENEFLYLAMELCEGGTLEQVINFNATVPLELATRWLSEIAEGCVSIHASGIMHRDLKPANILLTSTDLQRAHVKIADFGAARDGSSEVIINTASVGTLLYMAPEVYHGRAYCNKVDVWSFGAIADRLLKGPIFSAVNAVGDLEIAHEHTQDIDEMCGLPPAAIQLLKAALQRDASLRPSFAQLLTLDFFSPAPVVAHSALAPHLSTPPLHLPDLSAHHAPPGLSYGSEEASINHRLTEDLLPIYYLAEHFRDTNRKMVAGTLFRIYRLKAGNCIKDAITLSLHSDIMKDALERRSFVKKNRFEELNHATHGAGVLMGEARRLIDLPHNAQRVENLRLAQTLLKIGIRELEQRDRQWTELERWTEMEILKDSGREASSFV